MPLFMLEWPVPFWSVDFGSDVLDNDVGFRNFNILYDFNRQTLPAEICIKLWSHRLVGVSEQLESEPR